MMRLILFLFQYTPRLDEQDYFRWTSDCFVKKINILMTPSVSSIVINKYKFDGLSCSWFY